MIVCMCVCLHGLFVCAMCMCVRAFQCHVCECMSESNENSFTMKKPRGF